MELLSQNHATPCHNTDAYMQLKCDISKLFAQMPAVRR